MPEQTDEKEKNKINISLSLTPEEAGHLISEMDMKLGHFIVSSYEHGCFTNPDMGNALNQVFRALTGHDHPNCTPEKLAEMKTYHTAAQKAVWEEQERRIAEERAKESGTQERVK